MLYRFKSQATADVIMLSPGAEQVLQLIGKTPAPQGVVDVDARPAAIAALQQSLDAAGAGDPTAAAAEGEAEHADPVGLRQRVWPMLELLRQAHAAGKPVVWGV